MTPPQPSEAVKCLKYMLLTKIMTNNPEASYLTFRPIIGALRLLRFLKRFADPFCCALQDVYSIINGKAGLKYAGVEVRLSRPLCARTDL